MIFVVLFSAVGVAAWAVKRTIHDKSRRVPRWCSVYNWIAQVLLLILGAMDWAYSALEASPYELFARGYREPLAIFLPAVALVFLIPMRPRKRTGEALLLHAFQAIAFIPVLLMLEIRTSISFLSWNTCMGLTLSSSSALFALSPMLAYGAARNGRFHQIAYKDRSTLLAYVDEARQTFRDLQWSPPITFLDAGKVVGRVLDRQITLDTRFSFRPFGYCLDFRMALQREQSPWMIGSEGLARVVPEARQWAFISEFDDEQALHAPADHSLSARQLTQLSQIGAELRRQLLRGYLICTGDALSYRLIDSTGLKFDASSAQILLDIANTIDLSPDSRILESERCAEDGHA